MIGTIRKHSSWLWWVVAFLTIISFVIFMGQGGARNGGGKSAGYGTIYGQPVTLEDYSAAQREFFIYYWQHYGKFPDQNPDITQQDIERETYVRLLMLAKARQLGIHVSDEAQQQEAVSFLASLVRGGQAAPPLSVFVEKILQPEGLTATDFQRFIAHDLVVEQLAETLGLYGALVVPQEASQLYDRENQEISAQAVFFSASNYVSQVRVDPAGTAMFYTNYMAHYRLPDRVQINYVEFDLTNYTEAARAGETNIEAEAESEFTKHGMDEVPDAKTPEEAKAKIRQMIVRRDAEQMAGEKAMDFVRTLFAMDPVSPDNLVTLAQKDGLAVNTTAPFSAADGPEEFAAPKELVQTAFKLNPDSPFSKPIAGAESVYVIGLARQLPSAIPPLSEVQEQVAHDYRVHMAALMARTAGTNFYFSAMVQMATGKSFAQVALNDHQEPVALKPFSLSSQEIPEAEAHAQINEIKQAAFSTPPGHVSPVLPTAEGGFVMYVESLMPLDEAEKKATLPGFLGQLRHGRESEAFNLWLEAEASRELRSTPIYNELVNRQSASRSQ